MCGITGGWTTTPAHVRVKSDSVARRLGLLPLLAIRWRRLRVRGYLELVGLKPLLFGPEPPRRLQRGVLIVRDHLQRVLGRLVHWAATLRR